MRYWCLLILVPLLSFQQNDLKQKAKETCECIHSSNFKSCDQKHVSYNQQLIEELILYCDAYHAGFINYRNEQYSGSQPEQAKLLLEKYPLDIKRTNNTATLVKYVKWSFMANQHDFTLKIIEHMETLNQNNAEAQLYKGWVYEIWDDLYMAEEAYEKFIQVGGNKKLGYQCLAHLLWLEREAIADEE